MPKDTTIPGEGLSLTACDGVPLPAWALDGRGDRAPALMILPAMGVPARHYGPLAAELNRHGFHVLLLELRGVGESPLRPSRRVDFGYHHLVTCDLAAVVAGVRERWGPVRLVPVGHSLGGQLGMLYAARHPEDLAALVLTAAGTVFWRAYPLPFGLGVLAFTQVAAGLSRLLGSFPGHRLGFGGLQARTLIGDWARVARTGRWEPDGADLDYQAALERLHLPVLSVTWEGDRFAPRRAADALLADLEEVEPVRLHLSPDDTGSDPHLGWLRRPGPVAARIAEWLEDLSLGA